MTNTVFLGSPATAIPSLRALMDCDQVRLVGVVTQPDRPAGRRRAPQPSPIKREAAALGVPVYTPERIGAEEALGVLRGWGSELAIVCAYGQIFPSSLLALPRLGCFNLHFSLLPRWRGASPVQAAILAGDTTTGVSLQRMVPALDAGDIVAETPPLPIAPQDTAQTLGTRLADAAAELLSASLPLLMSGNPPLRPQDPARVTSCRTLRKGDGAVDFTAESAVEIERKCRAYTPWPGCFAFVESRRLGLVRVALAQPPARGGGEPVRGALLEDGRLAARQGWARLVEVRPEGKRTMPFAAYRNGNPAAIGTVLKPAPA